MINNKKVTIVLPAFNAARTLKKTISEIPKEVVDSILLVDDCSHDGTAELAYSMKIRTYVHNRNYGYGRNQKTCYEEALKQKADIIIMLHPDYQYTPKLVTAMASMIAYGEYDVVIASRILGRGAIDGGMPVYKYIANRILTAVQNLLLNQKLSEYHTGYRAFARDVLCTLPLNENSDDFLFDNQLLAQAIFFEFRIGEVSCPTKYFKEASSINFPRSIKYGLGVLGTSLSFWFHKNNLIKSRIFDANGRKLPCAEKRVRYYEPFKLKKTV